MNERAIVKVAGQSVRVGTDSWRGLIATFIATQDVKESSRTLYTRTLTQYFNWLSNTGRLERFLTLTRQDILEYKDSLLAANLSALTVSSYIVAVRKFYEWAEAEKQYPNIAKGVKTPRRKQAFKKQHLTDEKSGELLSYEKQPDEKIEKAISKEEARRKRELTDSEKNSIRTHFETVAARNYAIVNLMLRTGLRTVEVVRADVGDITYKGNKRVLLIWGKGHVEKDDFVVLTDTAYEPIKRYLETRKGAKAGEPLFTSTSHNNKGERLTTKTISSLCKEGLRAIGLEGREFTAHSLRHTTAVAILKHGGSITDVQDVLRHTSPATSQIYTESVKEELRLEKSPESLLDLAF